MYFNSSDPIGAVAQLGERRVRNAEVEGSIPFRSTKGLSSPEFGRNQTVDHAVFRICLVFGPSMFVRGEGNLGDRDGLHLEMPWAARLASAEGVLELKGRSIGEVEFSERMGSSL